MPYITEEIWQSLPHEGESLMVSAYPEFQSSLCFDASAQEMENVMALIKEIRQLRTKMNVSASKKTSLYIESDTPDAYRNGAAFIQRLAGAKEISFDILSDKKGMVAVITAAAKAYMPMGELIDIAQETARLQKEIEKIQNEIERANKKLSNEGFVAKAPAKLIEDEKQKRDNYVKKLENTQKALADLTQLKS